MTLMYQNQPLLVVFDDQIAEVETYQLMRQQAESFAHDYSLSLSALQHLHRRALSDEASCALVFSDSVYIQPLGKKASGPVEVSFSGNAMLHRLRHGGGKGEQVAKAVGLKKGVTPTVLDATAGLGRDALILAALGCEVTLFERHPVVRALLKDGIRRGSQSSEVAEVVSRLTLVEEDFLEASDELKDESYDVVYLDPMFPERSKSAMVKKEMRVFKDVVGGDLDSNNLFAPAHRIAKHRLVVKRPKLAPFLADKAPSHQLKGKSGRFDIYTKKAF